MRLRGVAGLVMAVLAVLAGLRTAGDAGYWSRYLAALWRNDPLPVAEQIRPRTLVPGGEYRAPARAMPESEYLAPEAIDAALALARLEGSRALLVHRRGHRVAEFFAHGASGDALVAGGELAPLPLALALAAAAADGELDADAVRELLRQRFVSVEREGWRNPWAAPARLRFALRGAPLAMELPAPGSPAALIADRVWRKLGAADAALGGSDPLRPAECCFIAQIDDWMRVADLLLQEGRYAGELVVAPEWIRELLPGGVGTPRVLPWRAADSRWVGDEPPAANQTTWMDLEPDLRLWLLPQRGLAVLHWARAGSGQARDTALPNIVIRGIVDPAPVPEAGTPLQQVVPGH